MMLSRVSILHLPYAIPPWPLVHPLAVYKAEWLALSLPSGVSLSRPKAAILEICS